MGEWLVQVNEICIEFKIRTTGVKKVIFLNSKMRFKLL